MKGAEYFVINQCCYNRAA